MGALFAPDTLIDSLSQKDAKEKIGAALELLPQDSYTVEKIRTPKLYTIYGSLYQVRKKCNMPLPQYVPRPNMPPKMPPPQYAPPNMPPPPQYAPPNMPPPQYAPPNAPNNYLCTVYCPPLDRTICTTAKSTHI